MKTSDDFYSRRPWVEHYPTGTPREIDWASLPPLGEMFRNACGRFSARDAFTNEAGQRLTYAELLSRASSVAGWLEQQGLRAGDRVALMLPNVLAFPVGFVAGMLGDFVVTCLNPLYTPREAIDQLRDSGARVLIIFEELLAGLSAALVDTSVRWVILAGSGRPDEVGLSVQADDYPTAVVPLSQVVASGCRQGPRSRPATPTELAVLQYTGGTTGVSKGAMLTHRNLASASEILRVWLEPWCKEGHVDRHLLMVAALPLYHIYALMCCCVLNLRFGATALLIRDARDIDGLVKTISNSGANILWGVNATFSAILNHPHAAAIDFTQLRLSVGGGAAMQSATAQAWRELTGQPVIEGYGLSETSPTVALNRLDDPEFSGTVGYPMPSLDVSLRDADNVPVPQGARGEVCVKGPTVMAGYWQRRDETHAAFTPDGFLRTGDVATMSAEGRMRIVDRLKDVVLVSGFNVYPNEVEDVLAHHPDVQEVSVVGVPSDRTGERLVAFVVPRGAHLAAEQLLAYARSELTGYKVPREVVFVRELPRSAVGKVLRRSLRDQYKEKNA